MMGSGRACREVGRLSFCRGQLLLGTDTFTMWECGPHIMIFFKRSQKFDFYMRVPNIVK